MTDPPPPPPPDLTPPSDGWYNNPVPTEVVKPVRGVGLTAIVATALTMLAAAFIAVMMPSTTDRARDFLDGAITEDEFVDGYNAIGAAQFAQQIGTLVAAIASMIWMYRMAKNIRAFGRSTTWAPVFGFVGWFLPPVLVIIPFLMLRELWRASAPFSQSGEDRWKSEPEYPVLWIWFVLYGVVQTLLFIWQATSLVGAGLSTDATDLAESIVDASSLSLISGLSLFASGVAWLVLVRRLTDRHMALIDGR